MGARAIPDKMFGDDPFEGIEDLFSQLAGERAGSTVNSQSQPQNILNTVETEKETILIFDLSGKRIDSVEIKDNLEINEYGEKMYNGKKILIIKLENNRALKYNITKNLSVRKIHHTFSNGILEVSLKK